MNEGQTSKFHVSSLHNMTVNPQREWTSYIQNHVVNQRLFFYQLGEVGQKLTENNALVYAKDGESTDCCRRCSVH